MLRAGSKLFNACFKAVLKTMEIALALATLLLAILKGRDPKSVKLPTTISLAPNPAKVAIALLILLTALVTG